MKVHQVMHYRRLPYRCNECKKTFIKKRKIKVRQDIHTGERQYRCDECN